MKMIPVLKVTCLIIFLFGLGYFVYVMSNPLEANPLSNVISPMLAFLIGMFSFGIFIFLIIYTSVLKPRQAWNKILATGLNAQGELIKSEPTGVYINNQPSLVLYFNIKAATGETWRTTLNACIPIHKMYMLAPGTLFNLKYDAQDKMKLAIVD